LILSRIVYGQKVRMAQLSFQHPKTGITKIYTALPPVDFEECLVMLGIDPPEWKDLVWVK
jgi:hypothetical protein